MVGIGAVSGDGERLGFFFFFCFEEGRQVFLGGGGCDSGINGSSPRLAALVRFPSLT